MNAVLPVGLPNIPHARLPDTYNGARDALAQCVKIDECKDWADKAEALASYAKQAEDDELRLMAERIRARALDRCGELLRAIPKEGGPGRGKTKLPDELSLSPRDQAARDAGLSAMQQKNAISINAIPRDQFETLVESTSPPSAKELAEMGRKKRERPLLDLGDKSPAEFAAATQLIGFVADFIVETKMHDIPLALKGCAANERRQLASGIKSAMQWLNNLKRTMEKAQWRTHARTSRRKSTASSKPSLKRRK